MTKKEIATFLLAKCNIDFDSFNDIHALAETFYECDDDTSRELFKNSLGNFSNALASDLVAYAQYVEHSDKDAANICAAAGIIISLAAKLFDDEKESANHDA